MTVTVTVVVDMKIKNLVVRRLSSMPHHHEVNGCTQALSTITITRMGTGQRTRAGTRKPTMSTTQTWMRRTRKTGVSMIVRYWTMVSKRPCWTSKFQGTLKGRRTIAYANAHGGFPSAVMTRFPGCRCKRLCRCG